MKVLFSHRIENLRDRFAVAMTQPSTASDLLAPEFVLVDNKVMGEWLNLQLAQAQGIAANINYLQPSGLFWKLAKWLLGSELPHDTPLLKEEMKWKLFALLADPDLLVQEDMRPVRDYLAGDADADDCSELKRFQLAAGIADLFDQYLIYRPDWLLAWQQGRQAQLGQGITDANEGWQGRLWRLLVASATVNGQCWHRAAIEQRLQQVLTENINGEVARRLPLQRLQVFGITSMYPSLVRLLQNLSRHIEVTLFVVNPCEEYWGLVQSARNLAQLSDDALYLEIGNPLLASQGVQVQEFIELLCESTDDMDFISDTEYQPQTLLQAIQQEIRRLEFRGQPAEGIDYVAEGESRQLPQTEMDANNGVPSVHIHQCHSPQREVEVLHDQVRDMLARNPGWRPRDIVVMMPRVTHYVPYIHAVFGSAPEGQRIPYRIADRTLAEESPLLNSVVTLLDIGRSRFALSEVLSLLEVPAVQRRFGLDQGGFEQLRKWLVQGGVRWGLDAQQRVSLGLPAYADYSWEFALNRLLAGYGMAVASLPGGDDLVRVNDYDVLPFDEVEGSNAGLLDSLLQFWERLQALRLAVQRPRSVGEWHDDLMQWLHDFYDPDDEDELRALNALRAAVGELQAVQGRGWCDQSLGIRVIRDVLKPALEQTAQGRHHWQEGIKFCSLLPMRAVPFKAVYVLGMNQTDYPRQVTRKSFDLMRHGHRPGDRASRIDDRWLFLEALLSARHAFHVSYVANDMHRNEKREPSVVLAELLDYLKHGYDLPEDWLFTRHPLQPFSPAYFAQGQRPQRLFSFDRQAFAIANARHAGQPDAMPPSRWSVASPAPGTVVEISLDEFARFFTKPWAWFLTSGHGIDIEVEDDGVDDHEPFALDNGLDRWALRSELVRRVNAQAAGAEGFEQVLEEVVAVRRASARWPVGQAGSRLQTELLDEREFYYATQGRPVVDEVFTRAFTVGTATLVVSGQLPVEGGGDTRRWLLHTPSRADNENRDKLLDLYIRFALAHSSASPLIALEANFRDDKKAVKQLLITPEQASVLPVAEFLQMLAGLYLHYRASGLPFDIGIAKSVAENVEDEAALYETLDEYWYGDGWNAGAADDAQKRIYFGAVSSVKDAAFINTCIGIQQHIAAWDAILNPKKSKGAAAEGEAS